MKKFIFGIDIGGTTCKIGLFDNTGLLLQEWETPTDSGNNGINVIDNLAETLHEYLNSKGISYDAIEGIGLGIPAQVAPDGRVVISSNVGWQDHYVGRELSVKMNGIPVKVIKDSNAAALGEMWKGKAKGYRNVSLITIGTGVGGANIVNGELVIGSKGAGGDFGHLTIYPQETEQCGCGRKGCLEQYASATAIVKQYKAELPSVEEAKGRLETTVILPSVEAIETTEIKTLTAKDIFEAYVAGEKVATKVINKFAKSLAQGMTAVACTTDPEIFLIGGGVSKAGQPLLDIVTKYYQELALGDTKHTKIELTELGNQSGIYGAAKLVLC